MMDRPLLVSSLLWRAEHVFPTRGGVSVAADGTRRGFTYAELCSDARRLAGGLAALGVRAGDRVSALAWNTYEYLAAYFAVPGMGAVLHTVNHRMATAHIAHTIRAAGSRLLLVDSDLLDVFTSIEPELEGIEHVVVIDPGADEVRGARFHAWDEVLDDAPPLTSWPEFDERSASGICFTSGTTGLPKGVVYSHRSTVLHALAISLAGAPITPGGSYLLATNMSHVNGWGVPYATVMQGSRLVLPGAHPTPARLLELIAVERPGMFIGSPTVSAMLRDLVLSEDRESALDSLDTVWLGGQAPPADQVEWFRERDIGVVNGWGMTETSPIASFLAGHETQGPPLPLVECAVVDENGSPLSWDGTSTGELRVRSPWVASSYLHDSGPDDSFSGGWLRTGDVCVIHPNGHLQIRDRYKDLIKSGGEWISSVELEFTLMQHPLVDEAAVIAVPDPTWQERPVAWVVAGEVSDEELRRHLARSFPKFWLPDAFVRVQEIPKTSVGKLDKKAMRDTQSTLQSAPQVAHQSS